MMTFFAGPLVTNKVKWIPPPKASGSALPESPRLLAALSPLLRMGELLGEHTFDKANGIHKESPVE